MKRFILIIGLIVATIVSSFLGVSSPTLSASSPTRSGIFCTSAYAQDDEIMKMYEELMTPQEREMLDRYEEAQRKSEEAQAVRHTKNMIALVISILVGLIPFVYLLVKSFKENTWKNNAGGTVWGLVIGLAGGVLLFAFNYGLLWMRMNHEGLLNAIITYGLVGALIVGVIYLLNKKG